VIIKGKDTYSNLVAKRGAVVVSKRYPEVLSREISHLTSLQIGKITELNPSRGEALKIRKAELTSSRICTTLRLSRIMK
jgi:hypothetical protein